MTVRRFLHRTLPALLCVAVLSAGALVRGAEAAKPASGVPTDAEIRAILQGRVDAGAAFGLAVGVLDQGANRIVAVGKAKDAAGAPAVDADTVFEIGSITKVFTAVVLADMAAKGEVRLEDPIAKYLPEGIHAPSKDGKEITFLDLATHRSGLPRMPSNFEPKDPGNPYADYSAARMFDFLNGYKLERAPGAAYEYSNFGMGLAGTLLARRAGKSYADLVAERVLRPLGMNDTAVTLSDGMKPRFADGHDEANQPAPHWDLDAMAGAGALRSTVKDLLKFVAANANPPDTSVGRALREAQGIRAATGNAGLDVALAWHIKRGSRGNIVWHNGGTGGFHSFIGFDPVRKTGVVVLSNSAHSIDDIGVHILDTESPVDHPSPRKEHKEVALSEAALQALVGEYQLAPTFSITITREGNQLFEQATAQPKFPIFPESETSFFLKVVDAQLSFEKDGSGKVTRLVLHQGGRDLPGAKMK